MRATAALALILLIPCAATAQTQAPPGTGHFDGWPATSQWGANKRAFEATTTVIRPRLGLLTVAENGFGWRQAFTDSDGTFFRWNEISAWCTASGILLIRTSEARRPVSYHNIDTGDMSTIVDEYLRRYAPHKVPSGPEIECNDSALRLPDDRDKVIQLLRAASEYEP